MAARFEDYSDFGSNVSFKGSVRYQPSRRVTLRAGASTGFRAPGLSQISFSKVVTNVIGGEFIDVGLFPADNPAAQALGAVPLKEETAYNLSAGVVLTPVDNFTVTADYFHIRINDQILLGATFDDAGDREYPHRRRVRRHRRRPVLHQRPQHPHPGRRHHGRLSRSRRPHRHARSHGGVQLDPEQDRGRRSAPAGADRRRTPRSRDCSTR